MREGIGELLDDIEDEINSKIIHLKNDFESGGAQHYFLIAEHKGKIIGQLKSGQQIRCPHVTGKVDCPLGMRPVTPPTTECKMRKYN